MHKDSGYNVWSVEPEQERKSIQCKNKLISEEITLLDVNARVLVTVA